MENRETKGKKENRGYLVIERGRDGRRILYADHGACTLSGYSMEKLLAADPEQAAGKLEKDKVMLGDGHELWILDTLQNRLQRRQELEQMNDALEDALKAAEAANKAKSNFLSNMSHDIRTPMNAIVGMTSIGLSHIDEKSRVQDCLQKIKTASTHLMSLVNDVLDMSRIDSGRMTLNEEVFSLADLVHDVTVIMRPQAELKKQSLVIDIGPIYEESLMGDTLRLRQILVNIIGNAVKYTLENGNVNVCFRQRRPEEDGKKEWEKDTVLLEFSCQDNGIGMSQEFLEKIFLPFERVNNTTISKIEGSGLGMAIVKNLVECMGGEISVESREGVGSRFEVVIPMSPALHGKKETVFPGGLTVVLAESRDDRAAQISGYLEEGGLEVIRTKEGMDTVTRLTEAQYENRMPCALLLGQGLEDMQVLDAAAHVRQLAGRDFPILLVSEDDWAQIEYRAARAGVNAFVPCPLFQSRLMETLGSLMDNVGEGERQQADKEADYGSRHVLLVEDIPLNQEIAMEILNMTGVQVETADNGAEALEKFEGSPQGHFDIIFMDIQMPVMDGYEAAKKIRALSRGDAESVWIVAMTANAFVEDIRLSREAGMNEHCSKPVDPERLQEILRSRFG